MQRLPKNFKARSFAYFTAAGLALLYALTCEIFIFPNQFAPAGINGFATMLQYVLGFQVGYFSLLVNLPLLAAAFFLLDRTYASLTLVYTVTVSVSLIFLGGLDLSSIVYTATDTGGGILAAIAGGLIHGALYSLSVRAGGSTGGTDVIAAFINRKHPSFDTVWIIFALNVAVAILSFFVYGMQYQPVILCAVYVFVSSKVSEAIFKGAKAAAKFEVITDQPEALAKELIQALHHGCTLISVKGMYTQTERSMLVCVVNRRQIVDFERIVKKYHGAFAYISTVNGTVGHFRRMK